MARSSRYAVGLVYLYLPNCFVTSFSIYGSVSPVSLASNPPGVGVPCSHSSDTVLRSPSNYMQARHAATASPVSRIELRAAWQNAASAEASDAP